jgi:hypothetical protein
MNEQPLQKLDRPNPMMQGEPKRPMDPALRGNDVAALNNLLGLMNNPAITGADVPADAETKVAFTAAAPPVPVAPTPAPSGPQINKRTFFTGRLAVGKDYVAEQIGAPIFGFADPLYYLATFFFGVEVTATKNKDLPGMRAFLQQAGQWGRNDVDEQYPYTPARATFCAMIRSFGAGGMFDARQCVNWNNFGIDPLIWVDSMLERCSAHLASQPDSRVATTNVRFKHEFKALSEGNWDHWHVMCSPQTWAKRLQMKKIAPNAPVLNDKSEHMAMQLDDQVRKVISAERNGKFLKVIWNDPEVPSPSSRIMTLAQFCDAVAQTDSRPVPATATVHTGE